MKKKPCHHHTTIILALTTALLTLLIPSARAANFVLQATDASGSSSFNGAVNFKTGNTSGGTAVAPSAGNTYQTGAFRIRTPADASSYAFKGDSLEIQAGLGMRNKNTGTITVTNLIVADTGLLELSANGAGTLAGNISLTSGTATIIAGNSTDGAGANTFTISAAISGTGGINTSNGAAIGAIAASNGKVIMSGSNTFSGGVTANGLAGSILQISGTNTYSGNTTVSVGTLALTGGALITNSASIVVASNAIFNVSGLNNSFVLASTLSSQTLSNSAPGAIINGTNNCSAGTVSLVYDGVNPAFTITNGGMTLSAATTIKINNTGAQLTAGSYKIIAKATAGNLGLVAGAVTASAINVDGSGAANTATLAIVSGELWLNVAGASATITLTGPLSAVNTTYGTPSPSPTSFTVSGSNLSGPPGNLTVTPPSGYEVSRTNNSGYSTSLSVPYSSGTLASTNVYVRLTAAATVPGSPYSGDITVSGGAATPQTIATVSSTVSKVTPTVTVTVGSYSFTGFPQGPNAFTTVPAGDTGTATWSYVGVSGTTYGPSGTPPAAAGSYTAQVTALTSDANFNSSSSSATAFSIANANVLFADNYTVSGGANDINFQNTLGREVGSLSPLSYLTRYTGANAYRQQLGSTTAFPGNTNALLLFGDAGVRVDYDFATVGAPIEIKWSVVMNWFGLANTNSLIVGNRSDGYDPTNAAFAFQLRNNGATSIFTNGIVTAGAPGSSIADNVLVNYKVILSDTAGTGSPFGSGGSKAAYYQNGTLLGTATISQLAAGQGYLGFVGGDGNVGVDNLQITSLATSSITLTGTLGAVNTIVGTASATPTSFQISGNNLTGAPGNLTVTPPSGYEISLSSGSGYSTNLSVPYSSGTLASTSVYVRLAATTAVGSYFGNITVAGGGDAKAIATVSSTVSKLASTITYGSTSFTYNGSGQGPSITFSGSTGAKTTNYVGTSTTTYSSLNAPTNVGTYYVSNTVASDANYNGVTNTQSFTINQATTTATLAVANTPATYNGSGQSATVSITASNTPGAVVNIQTGGAATQTASGTYAVTADYVPANTNYTTVTGIAVGSFVINKVTTTATLAVANTPATYNGSGQSATVSITASNTPGAVVNIQTGGAATQTASGTYAVTADYVPANTNYTTLTGIAVGNFVINQASTFVGATSTQNPSGYKDTVSYIATLPTDATGNVVFSSTNGAFSTNTVSGITTTSLSITNLPRGTNLITVAYLGDGNYVGSTNTLDQIVTNHPPAAVDATYYRAKGLSLKIAITNLLSNVTDADGDTNNLQSVGAGLTNATIMTDSSYVYYLPGTGSGSNDNDVVSYTVSDGFGGTATANILVNVYSAAGPAQMSIPTNGVVNITFFGIPNYTYIVQTTTNLSVPWWTLSTNTAGTNGIWQFTDPNATNAQQYYRSSQP